MYLADRTNGVLQILAVFLTVFRLAVHAQSGQRLDIFLQVGEGVLAMAVAHAKVANEAVLLA